MTLSVVYGQIQIASMGQQGVGIPAGGTTGQILAKASDSNFDTGWISNDLGTVSSVSVVSANGISGSVANPTTTPAITLELGDITPSSVSASGDLSGSNFSGSSSGVNTGDQANIIGNAGTATILETARAIGGVSFNGSADIVPQTIQSIDESSDSTCFPLFINQSGAQSLQPKNNINLTYNAATGAFGATSFIGNTATLIGAALKQKELAANTGAAYTVDAANAETFNLTMNSATPTITIAAGTTSTTQDIVINLIQDSSGNRAPTFSGVTYYTGATPAINQGAAAITTLSLKWTNGVWTLYAANPLIMPSSMGGTGVSNNNTSTLTMGGAVTFSGAYTFTGTLTNNVSVSFPIDGTLISTTTNFMPGDNTTITGTTYTLALADAGKFFACSNASAQVITIPPYGTIAFLPDTEIAFEWSGVGQVSFLAGSGVTINSDSSALKIASRYSVAVLKKDHTATNTWTLFGNIVV